MKRTGGLYMNNRQTNDFGQAFVAFTGGFKNPFSHSTLSKKRLFLILAALTLVILGFSSYVLLIPLNFENAEFRRLLTVLLLLWSLPLLFPSTSPKEKKKLFTEFRKSREEMKDLLTAKANVDRVLGYDGRAADKQKEQTQR